jgi:nitrile hydratase accessory protein
MTADPTLRLEGAAALPRRNGEPQFSAPWQSRAFGMAMALYEQRAFEWDEFRVRLVAEIAAATGDRPERDADEDGSLYYRCWLGALTAVLADRGAVPAEELARRAEEFRSGLRREVY